MSTIKTYKRNNEFRNFLEKAFDTIYGNGWPANLAYRLGFQHTLEINSYDICLDGNLCASSALRIAFVADFHASQTTHPALLANAFDKLQAIKPDLILIGGDFVTHNARHIDAIAEQLGKITVPLGHYAVLGNHDYWTDPEYLAEKLRNAGIKVLINSNVQLPGEHSKVWICGLNDHRTGTADPEATFSHADGVRIVLMHAPDGLLFLKNHRFELAFCGHTHGGQISLPGGKPIITSHGVLNRKYNHGLYQLQNRTNCRLIVSRGIGCAGLPIRINATSEIVICNVC